MANTTSEQHGWIDCSEQVPANDGWVLGWNDHARGAWIYSYSPNKREWHSHSGVRFNLGKITHWMPLPEGPTR